MKDWLKAALVRAVKTAAQTAIAALPVTGFMLGEVNWIAVLSMAAGGFVLSLLTSLAGIPEADGGKSPFATGGYENGGGDERQ